MSLIDGVAKVAQLDDGLAGVRRVVNQGILELHIPRTYGHLQKQLPGSAGCLARCITLSMQACCRAAEPLSSADQTQRWTRSGPCAEVNSEGIGLPLHCPASIFRVET